MNSHRITRRAALLSLSAGTLLAGCAGGGSGLGSAGSGSGSGSGLNPFGWFRRRRRDDAPQSSEPADARVLVDEVASLRIERLPGGVIVRAVGLPATQGYWDAELVPLGDEKPDKGVLSYEFRVMPPEPPARTGPARSREVLVARFVSSQTLEGVRRITVIGRSNRRTARR